MWSHVSETEVTTAPRPLLLADGRPAVPGVVAGPRHQAPEPRFVRGGAAGGAGAAGAPAARRWTAARWCGSRRCRPGSPTPGSRSRRSWGRAGRSRPGAERERRSQRRLLELCRRRRGGRDRRDRPRLRRRHDGRASAWPGAGAARCAPRGSRSTPTRTRRTRPWSPRLGDATGLIVLDQITSPTARLMPVERDRRGGRGGAASPCSSTRAHVPGLIEAPLAGVTCDFWVGNLHKWAARRAAPRRWSPAARCARTCTR